MKKILSVLLVLALLTGSALAFDKGQVTCNSSTATRIGPAGSTAQIFRALTIQNQTPSVGVYVGPGSDLTAINGPILLSSTTSNAYVAENPVEDWYCITSNSTATVGYIRR